jgi:L-ascorbate metabolism protein UlaG (beta-lactamase superfamily)
VIEPLLSDDAFLADVAAARRSPDLLHLWWLGQSGFLVNWNGHHLLFDPYLSDSLTLKYSKTDKPHVRMSRRVVDPARLDFIEVVTSSHTHTDHLDADTLRPLARANSNMVLVAPEANRKFIQERLGVDTPHHAGFQDGQQSVVGAFDITAVAAAHEGLDQDDQGRNVFLGYVVRCGPWTIYHSGDTILYDGLVEKLRQFKINVALLPINGRGSERRVAGNLWGREAAWLANKIGAEAVLPCHYDMFVFNTATPDEFVAECERLNQPYWIPQLGQAFISVPMGT